MTGILIVDDDVKLTVLLREYLELEGFVVDSVHDGAALFQKNHEKYELLVLDVMMPGMSGVEILKRLRETSQVPVIMLTARDGENDRILGLETGADDYGPKPVNPRELVARIRAVLRRGKTSKRSHSGELVIGPFRLNTEARRAFYLKETLEVTSAEYNLLEHMLRNAGRVISRDELSAAAFGRQQSAYVDRNVDTLISKVRRKVSAISGSDEFIKTVRNAGYLFAVLTSPSVEAERGGSRADTPGDGPAG